jgi:hypothetical protein
MRLNFKADEEHTERLKGYDYSRAGAYFVTICVQNRACLFGDIVDSEMVLNDVGRMVKEERQVFSHSPTRAFVLLTWQGKNGPLSYSSIMCPWPS